MTIQVCWFEEEVTPQNVMARLGLIEVPGSVTIQPRDWMEPAEKFDRRNHRWVIECSGDFDLAIRLTQEVMALLQGVFGISGYRLLVQNDHLRGEALVVADRFLARVEMFEAAIREQVKELKKSRQVTGNVVFQHIREELERVLRFDVHSWQPPGR